VAVLVAASAVGGCGSSHEKTVPTRSQFARRLAESQGPAFASAISAQGGTAGDARRILLSFGGCVYDKIADEPDTVRRIYTASGDSAPLAKVLSVDAPDCLTAFEHARPGATSTTAAPEATTTTRP
jgi:hypothetical protein